MHIVNSQSLYFVFACLYLFLNIHYKYIMLRFSIPQFIKTLSPGLLGIQQISLSVHLALKSNSKFKSASKRVYQVISSQLFRETCIKSENIVYSCLSFQKSDVI